MRFALLLIIFLVGAWMIASFLAIRQVYRLFYQHAIRATPFVVVLVSLAGLGTQASYLLTRPIQPGSFLGNTLVISAGVLCSGIILSGILLWVWTSPRLSGSSKMGIIGLTACALLLIIFAASLL